MKRAMNRQPIRDIVDADRTTTITLPAMLTNAPSPAPTMIWASCTIHVSAAQSTPVPRSCPAGLPFPRFLCTWWEDGRRAICIRIMSQEERIHFRNSIRNTLTLKCAHKYAHMSEHAHTHTHAHSTKCIHDKRIHSSHYKTCSEKHVVKLKGMGDVVTQYLNKSGWGRVLWIWLVSRIRSNASSPNQ